MRRLRERAPARLDFDFRPGPRRMGKAGWLLWLVAIAFSTDVAWSYVKTRSALDMRNAELATAPAGARAAEQKTYTPRDAEREVAFARTTVHKIALPWAELFRALGASAMEGVSLMSVQPNADTGVVQIGAQAQSIPAMLTYVSRMEATRFFPSVTLVRHEMKSDSPSRPVSFVVVATWNTRR